MSPVTAQRRKTGCIRSQAKVSVLANAQGSLPSYPQQTSTIMRIVGLRVSHGMDIQIDGFAVREARILRRLTSAVLWAGGPSNSAYVKKPIIISSVWSPQRATCDGSEIPARRVAAGYEAWQRTCLDLGQHEQLGSPGVGQSVEVELRPSARPSCGRPDR